MSKLPSQFQEAMAKANLPAAEGPYQTTGEVFSQMIGAHRTIGVAVHNGKGRAIAYVYAGFGDGIHTAQLLAKAPELRDACMEALRCSRALESTGALPRDTCPADLSDMLARVLGDLE